MELPSWRWTILWHTDHHSNKKKRCKKKESKKDAKTCATKPTAQYFWGTKLTCSLYKHREFFSVTGKQPNSVLSAILYNTSGTWWSTLTLTSSYSGSQEANTARCIEKLSWQTMVVRISLLPVLDLKGRSRFKLNVTTAWDIPA